MPETGPRATGVGGAPVDSPAMVERVGTEPSIFTRILRGEVPGEVVLQTDDVFVLRDIAPQAPVHLLVIPRSEAYADVVALAAGDPQLLAHMVEAARTAAARAGADDFRLLFNTGAGAGQSVFHVHAHVLAGGLDERALVGAEAS